MKNEERVKQFEKRIGYQFEKPEILVTALTHSSYSNEKKLHKYECNERLEFLGDAVLELVSSGRIFRENPKKPEGDLTRIRASYVCEPTLALCAREIGLGDFILLGRGEDMTGGRDRDSILSDAMEATIGAVYLDGGFSCAEKYVEEFVLKDIEKKLDYRFYRCHRSYIINKDNISEIDLNNLIVHMKNGETCPISVRLKKGLKKLIN